MSIRKHLCAKSMLKVALTLAVAGCSDTGGTTEPATPVATTITISSSSISLDALGATEQLSATVLDQNGSAMAGATVSWDTDNGGVATVSTSGLVTAIANGTATVTATSGSTSATASVTVDQVPAALEAVQGDGDTGAVGAAVDIVAQVDDSRANPISDVGVTLAVTAGDGTLSASSGTTDASGQVTVTWTLGETAGDQAVTATVTANTNLSVTFSVAATPDAAASVALSDGNDQTGLVNTALPTPIAVIVADQFGNPVSGHTVTFAVTGGGGLVSTASANTGMDGVASATWTLGPAGAQSAEAVATGLAGSPVQFAATATTLSLTSVSPDPLIEGGTATLTGTGFDLAAVNNSVMVDGQAATVTAASATSLTVTLPTYDCRPARSVQVNVAVGNETSNAVDQLLNPASSLNLAVGEQQIIQDPADYCLQFMPDATGGDSYLIGVSATAEVNAEMSFKLTGTTAVTAGPGLVASVVAAPRQRAGIPARPLTALEQELQRTALSQTLAERHIREWDRINLSRPQILADRNPWAAQRAAVVPSVGDTLPFNMPDIDLGNVCTDIIAITTVVRKVGTRGIFVEDVNNPTDDPFTDADLQGFSDTFDNDIYDVLIDYFGSPTDIDDNGGRIVVILTKEVNAFALGVAGFVTSGDLLDPASCAASNQGEIFYGYVPDPLNTSGGPFSHSRSAVVRSMPPLIAHEVTHTIQFTRRTSGFSMASWEAEGQADLAKEVVGMSVLGDATAADLGASVVNGVDAGDVWYLGRFQRLARYFGWDNATGNVGSAPESCSLFGYTGSAIPCKSAYFYGASWSFHRYINDRFGPSYTGGEQALQRDWVGANVNQRGRANVEALLNVDFGDLFAQWAAMLYLDGRVSAAQAGVLELTSWDLLDIYQSLDPSLILAPSDRGFSNFVTSASVRGGSTYYGLITAAGARSAMAVRLRDALDAVLPTTLTPRYWIVRVQ